jgi:hypothetical protein
MVGTRAPACPIDGADPGFSPEFGPSPVSTNTAVLLRVFLQDDSCGGVRYFSDGTSSTSPSANHAEQTGTNTVVIVDAGAAPACNATAADRAPDPGDYNLVATVTIEPQPA